MREFFHRLIGHRWRYVNRENRYCGICGRKQATGISGSWIDR